MDRSLFKEKKPTLLVQIFSILTPTLSGTILLVDGITYFYLVLALLVMSIAFILELPDSIVKTLACVALATNISVIVIYTALFLYVIIGTALGF